MTSGRESAHPRRTSRPSRSRPARLAEPALRFSAKPRIRQARRIRRAEAARTPFPHSRGSAGSRRSMSTQALRHANAATPTPAMTLAMPGQGARLALGEHHQRDRSDAQSDEARAQPDTEREKGARRRAIATRRETRIQIVDGHCVLHLSCRIRNGSRKGSSSSRPISKTTGEPRARARGFSLRDRGCRSRRRDALRSRVARLPEPVVETLQPPASRELAIGCGLGANAPVQRVMAHRLHRQRACHQGE